MTSTPNQTSIKAAIIGGTGYTGAELLRLLHLHPNVEVTQITSRSEAGKHVSELFKHLAGQVDLTYTLPEDLDTKNIDVVFYATPNGIAMNHVPELLSKGVKVIDLAADFRIQDVETWEKWYGQAHACPDVICQAIYGLPEFNRDAIKGADLVANPGCYATAVQLALYPLLKSDLIETTDIIADCKSGVSGAGRGAAVSSLFTEVSESFKAYKVEGHRHQPEICESLGRVSGKRPQLIFTPHLVPMIRGIECTIYAKPKADIDTLQNALELSYSNEPFVTVLPLGSIPDTAAVRGSNTVQIGLSVQDKIADQPNRIILMAVEDNLVKGAAGQAVQNMNLMFELEETTGLRQLAMLP